jgi:hypothetical protein
LAGRKGHRRRAKKATTTLVDCIRFFDRAHRSILDSMAGFDSSAG